MKNQKTLILSILFIGGALLCGVVGLFASSRAGRRVDNLKPATVTLLEATQPGEEVLVEGVVLRGSGSVGDRPQPGEDRVQPEGFVAYVREGRTVYEDGDTSSWSVEERVTPPLLLELSDGWVQVQNDDYDIVDGHTVEIQYEFDEPSDTRYEGLKAGDSVIAVGVLAPRVEYPQLEADFVALGTRESYVARRRTGGRIFCAASIIVAIVGGVILLWDRLRG
ncbi:MAG: hypothetical protein ACP5GX_08395 [Anaerolineae bacterium]